MYSSILTQKNVFMFEFLYLLKSSVAHQHVPFLGQVV